MSFPRVTHYKLSFFPGSGRGEITLMLMGGQEAKIAHLEPNTFHALSVVLREERPIFFDPATMSIQTGAEPVGEDEID